MGLSKSQRELALAVTIALVLVLAVYFGHRHMAWMKQHCHDKKGFLSGMHGWRDQHWSDNPYNGQQYLCGHQGKTYEGGVHAHRRGCVAEGKDNFMATFDWPTDGSYGALADTYPYGNYADGIATFYPTYEEQDQNKYWSRA
jgi:hypothetical protein